MSVELQLPRWGEIPVLSLSLIHLPFIPLSLSTLLVSLKASAIPESPEYFNQY